MEMERKSPRGRPRKHESKTARNQAWREAHDLRKLTVDVPAKDVGAVRNLAHLARVLEDLPRHADGALDATDNFPAFLLPNDALPHWQTYYSPTIFVLRSKYLQATIRPSGGWGGRWDWRVEGRNSVRASGFTANLWAAVFIVELTFDDYWASEQRMVDIPR